MTSSTYAVVAKARFNLIRKSQTLKNIAEAARRHPISFSICAFMFAIMVVAPVVKLAMENNDKPNYDQIGMIITIEN